MGIKAKQRLFFYICVALKLRGYSQEDFVFDSSSIKIGPLNLNTKESEFSPFKIGNRLYYTSSKERRIGVINLDRSTGRQMYDIYYAEIKDSVTVKGKRPLINTINTALNQGTCFFDQFTSKLYYAGNVPSTKKDKFKLAIFSSEFKANKFLPPKVELLLPDTFVASHPMVYDKRLYFSSNLAGGKGKADIYSAELLNGRWTNIKNLESVNSPYDDYFPYVINETEIYFASNRPGGFGKLDLYKYTFDDGVARIKNLGAPINSMADDFGMFVEPKQNAGYFSTNRNNNQDDIYHFKKVWPSFKNCVDAIKESYCFDFTDEKSLETDTLNGYFYEWDFGDGTKQKGLSVTHCYLQPGNYIVNLNIIDVSTKALFLNQTALDVAVDSIVQLKINALDTMLVNKKFTINTAGTYLPDKKIIGYYFEVDNKRIQQASFEHNFAQLGKHKIKLGIEYEDQNTKQTGLMCTTLEVTCVDSTLWLPYEKNKIEEMVAKFDGKNIQAGSNRLEDLNYDAELLFNQKLGLSKEKMADRVDDYLSSETTRQIIAKITEDKKNLLAKNIGTNVSGLSSEEEEAFLAFKEKLKQNQNTSDGFNGKNIAGNPYGLSAQEEEAFLAFKEKQQQNKSDGFNARNIGGNGSGLNTEDEEAFLVFKFKQEQNKAAAFNAKNIGNVPYGLSAEDEEAFLVFKEQLKQTAGKGEGFDAKNIGNNPYGLSDQEEEAFLTFKTQQKQAVADGFNAKNIGGIGNGLSAEDEEALLLFKFKQQQALAKGETFKPKPFSADPKTQIEFSEQASILLRNKNKVQTNLFGSQRTNGNIDTLLHVEEAINVTFRVHLGTSKVKRDTSYLHSIGLTGIKEEFINGEYIYTYKNENRVNNIEKFYQKAVAAGVKTPVVIAYNKNVLIPNQAQNFRPLDFEVRTPQELTVEKRDTIEKKQNLFARLFKKNKKSADTLVSVQNRVDSIKVKQLVKDTTLVVGIEKDSVLIRLKKSLALNKRPISKNSETEKLEDTTVSRSTDNGATAAGASSAGSRNNPTKPTNDKVVLSFPVARKPKDVKIEDLPTNESELVAANNLAKEFMEKFGEASAPDLLYKVQISAFKYRNRYEFPHLANLGQIENTLGDGGLTRITIGGAFYTYKQAVELNKKVVAAGQKDAFVTVFYQGKRVFFEDLEKMGIFRSK
jgi:hypothetical protein